MISNDDIREYADYGARIHGGAKKSGWEEAFRLKQLSRNAQYKQKCIFASIMALSILFPPVGLLALYGKFDAAISWYTHGELDGLNRQQRGHVKTQLLVYAVLYPCILIPLVVYYSVHG